MQNNIEKERSYVFDYTTFANKNIYAKINELSSPDSFERNMIDTYLSKEIRIRHILYKKNISSPEIILTTKYGSDKLEGRIENNCNINHHIKYLLDPLKKLIVEKVRQNFKYKNFNISIDKVNSPLKLMIVEIESLDQSTPLELHKLLGSKEKFIECPLSAFEFFKRRIGICGPPSSGKTELSKSLSGLINTRLGGSSIYCSEYCSEFICRYNRPPLPEEQYIIFDEQQRRENNILNRSNIVISDSPTFLPYLYQLLNCKKSTSNKCNLFSLEKLYANTLLDTQNYTDIFLLQPQKIIDDGIRYNIAEEVEYIYEKICDFLYTHNLTYTILKDRDPLNIIKQLFYING